jgi:hypothetical protein
VLRRTDVRLLMCFDQIPRPGFLRVILYPYLGQGGIDGELAQRADGIGVEDLDRDTRLRQQVRDDVRIGEIDGGVNAFHAGSLATTETKRPGIARPFC